MQQDAFLPYVESGLFTFIDATTENPSCEVNSALLSRARVYVLQSLTVEELQQLVDRAAAALNDGLEAGARIDIAPDAREQLAAWADGGARRLISALHKAVRGSNPDAALYWFCRLIDGGADPKYLVRRLVRMAVEDIGLADPRATGLAMNGADIYERLGSPEGELTQAHRRASSSPSTAARRCRFICAMRRPS